jgi:hypothetical protein
LTELLDIDPQDSNSIKNPASEASIHLLIRVTHGDIFKKKYTFDKLGVEGYPLVPLCLLGASVDLLKAVYSAYPAAIGDVVPEMIENKTAFKSLKRLVDEEPDALATLKEAGVLKETDLSGRTLLHRAIRDKVDKKVIRFLILVSSASLKIKSNEYGWTPFLQLCATKSSSTLDLMKLFIENYPDVLQDKSTTINNSPLHLAICNLQPLPVVKFLLEKMGNDALMEKTDFGETPLRVVCTNENASHSIIKYLLEAQPAALYVRNPADNDPLNGACRYHSPELVESIIDKYPDVLKQEYFTCKWNLLQVGAYNGWRVEIMQLLVAKMGHDALEIRDGKGWTLLHLAVIGKKDGKSVSMELIEYLVKEYPGATKIANNEGHLPMDTDMFLEVTLDLQSQRDEERATKRCRTR